MPSNIEKNPRKEINAITLRNGKELEEVVKEPRKKVEKDKKVVEKVLETDESDSSKEAPTVREAPNVSAYKPKVPFPARLKQQQLDQQFSKFFKVFKKLHINIPFIDALRQMPSYAKFLKEILGNNRKLDDYETVRLNEECSAIIQRKLPPKLKDPRSFTIPCSIGSYTFNKVLCDLGADINLMPL